MVKADETDPRIAGSTPPWMGLQMAEHDAFLRAIRDEPDDDVHRLVYADYLEETGEPIHVARAHLIRLQMNELQYPDDCAKRRRLRLQSRALLREHESHWIGLFRNWQTHGFSCARPSWAFHRGFVESITIDATAFPEIADAIFESFPIRELEIRGIQGDLRLVDAIATSRHLQQIRSLRFAPAGFNQEGLGDAGLERLLRSPNISRLRELSIERQRLSNHAIVMLANCPALTGLKTLRIGFNRPNHSYTQTIDGEAMAILAGSPHLRQLTHLDLSHLDLGIEGIESICDAPSMQSLTDLNVQRCSLGSQGVQTVASSKHLKHLMRLNLRNNRLGVRAATAIAHSRTLTQLKILDMSSNRITDPGIASITESENAQSLRALILRRNRLEDDTAEAIARSPYLSDLLTLDLRHNQLSLEGGKILALSDGFPQLEHLDLRGNAIAHSQRAELRKLLGRRFGRL